MMTFNDPDQVYYGAKEPVMLLNQTPKPFMHVLMCTQIDIDALVAITLSVFYFVNTLMHCCRCFLFKNMS